MAGKIKKKKKMIVGILNAGENNGHTIIIVEAREKKQKGLLKQKTKKLKEELEKTFLVSYANYSSDYKDGGYRSIHVTHDPQEKPEVKKRARQETEKLDMEASPTLKEAQ